MWLLMNYVTDFFHLQLHLIIMVYKVSLIRIHNWDEKQMWEWAYLLGFPFVKYGDDRIGVMWSRIRTALEEAL